MDEQPAIAVAPVEQRTKSAQRTLHQQVWGYTLFIMVSVGALVCLFANDARLFLPIAGLSILVGAIGSLRVALRTMGAPDAGPTSIFR